MRILINLSIILTCGHAYGLSVTNCYWDFSNSVTNYANDGTSYFINNVHQSGFDEVSEPSKSNFGFSNEEYVIYFPSDSKNGSSITFYSDIGTLVNPKISIGNRVWGGSAPYDNFKVFVTNNISIPDWTQTHTHEPSTWEYSEFDFSGLNLSGWIGIKIEFDGNNEQYLFNHVAIEGVVPEPSTYALLLGIASLAVVARRQLN